MKTILLIDDSGSHSLLLEEELSEEGYYLLRVPNNEDALSQRQAIQPDLIILELKQNNAGEESFAKLKRLYPRVPWVGYSTLTRCPQDFKKWIDFFLPKSSDLGKLKRLIKSLLPDTAKRSDESRIDHRSHTRNRGVAQDPSQEII